MGLWAGCVPIDSDRVPNKASCGSFFRVVPPLMTRTCPEKSAGTSINSFTRRLECFWDRTSPLPFRKPFHLALSSLMQTCPLKNIIWLRLGLMRGGWGAQLPHPPTPRCNRVSTTPCRMFVDSEVLRWQFSLKLPNLKRQAFAPAAFAGSQWKNCCEGTYLA